VIRIHAPQAASLLLAVISLITWSAWALENRRQWPYAIPPITWVLHALIFYLGVFARDYLGWLPGVDFKAWSAVLRLHAMFLVLGCGLVFLLGKIVIRPE
jgi:hypothetical protein